MKRALLGIITCSLGLLAIGQANNYPNGSTVANFTVTDVEGNVHDLYNYTSQGKYVIVDFFFDTCGPCQTWQPTFSQLHETYGCNSADLICLTLNNGTDNTAAVIAYEATYGGPYAHAPAVSTEGGGGTVTSTFGVTAFPTFCLISPNNVMINHDIWPLTDMNTFVQAFPSGSNIQPAACVAGIGETGALTITNVHPTPSTGLIEVQWSSTRAAAITVEIYDLVGHRVRTSDLGTMTTNNDRRTLDLSDLSDGCYLLKLNAGGRNSAVSRITIAR
ncbi:MAG: T9SS type A sorting domain-containing protein [Flavobacteriales bacterium]|nr:T9SS type A sorting domain-containing protein [Flavobacteriales bacterium]MCB9166404.1 T9SS type A sorting domain-containing protein [Flavobacteriales bacterium]